MDGPSSSTLPEHWRTFSNTAAAAGANGTGGGSSSSAAQRSFARQESQVAGLQAPAGVAQQGGTEQSKVSWRFLDRQMRLCVEALWRNLAHEAVVAFH